MDLHVEDTDTLAGLEDRILRAVQLVGKLKQENASLAERLVEAETAAERATAAKDEAEAALATYKATAGKAEQELEILLAERKQVKTRIEKLLGQMDLLNAG